jgi:hypothetical protein
MITLPSLLTDNLYKFIAISGLVLIVTSAVIIWSHDKTLTSILQEQTRRTSLLAAEGNKVINGQASVEQKKAEIAQTEAELESGYKVFDIALGTANFYGFLAIGLELVGLLATVIGFWLWYARVQVHQDRILAAQAKLVTEPKSQE